MDEFTGQLIGGPDDGNMVTSSKPSIPVLNRTVLWLDGETGDASVCVTLGMYVWKDDKSYFTWQLMGSEVSVQKVEELV